MENKDKDIDAEANQPLKNSDSKAPENNENGGKEVNVKKKSGLSRLSRIRTAAFFGALFLCLAVVFAFTFIIPCPVRPISERTWRSQYDNAIGFPLLSIEDVNGDNVQDVLFLFKTDNASALNISCEDGGFKSPCVFLTALSGTNGSTLWISPVSDNDVQLLQCGIHNLGDLGHSGCLFIGNAEFILAVDSEFGNILWKNPTGISSNSKIIKPLLEIQDVDHDGVQDLMLFLTAENEVHCVIISRKNSNRFGQIWRINSDKPNGYYTHITKSKAEYVLFYTDTAIKGYSVAELCANTAGSESALSLIKHDPDWEAKMNTSEHYIPILTSSSSGKIIYLLSVPGKNYNNILVVTSEISELLDGQTFENLWSVNTTNILSKPTLGNFKRDVLSIIIETETENNRKKIMIIDSNSGTLQWEIEINLGSARLNPGVLNTGDHRSTFLFWGDYSTNFNYTMEPKENLYMFHPSQPNALLQLNNYTENIIVFRAALFERSRHACYVIITGPFTKDDPAPLTVSKRKLKEDISHGKILWFGSEDADTEVIRDHFFRMRYSSH
ncbi:protein FAM234A [Gastrophryne carolinensis]